MKFIRKPLNICENPLIIAQKTITVLRIPNHYTSKLWVLLALLFLGACSYQRKNVLFKTDKKLNPKEAVYIYNADSSSQKRAANYKHRIKPGDRVIVNFLNNYDIGQAAFQSATSTANMNTQADKGYLVNYDSTITLPLLGRTNIVGLTRLEAAKKLEAEYGKYVINPIIEVNIASLSVTILGEVNTPGKIILDKENTTIVDALALSGGLKDSGKKKNIKIIRGKEVILVDLRKINALNSQEIIIQDGDIIYVEPYGLKAQTESFTTIQGVSVVVLTLTQFALLTFQIINYTKQ